MIELSQKGPLVKKFAKFMRRYSALTPATEAGVSRVYERRRVQVLWDLGHPLFERFHDKEAAVVEKKEMQFRFWHLGKGIKICPGTGEVKIKVDRYIVLQWVKFIGIWVLTFLAISRFWGTKRIKEGQNNAIILGFPAHWISHENKQTGLLHYLDSTPIGPLYGCDNYIIQNHEATKDLFTDRFLISRFAEQALIRNVDLGFCKRVYLLFLHICSFFVMHARFLFQPVDLLFARELGCEQALLKLDQWKVLQSVFLTTTHLANQPTWVQLGKNCSVHLKHYSAVPIMHVDKKDPDKQYADIYYPLLGAMPMKHWVWSKNDVHVMKVRYGIENSAAVGIPAYLLKSGTRVNRRPKFAEVVIFDVTPVSPNSPIFEDLTFYYGNTSLACQLQGDTCSVVDMVSAELDVEIKVRLKPKRSRNYSRDDEIYYQFISDLKREKPNFEVCSPATILDELLQNDAFVICRPFTSAAVAVCNVGAECVYFDPLMVLENTLPTTSKLSFVSGENELKVAMKKHLSGVAAKLR